MGDINASSNSNQTSLLDISPQQSIAVSSIEDHVAGALGSVTVKAVESGPRNFFPLTDGSSFAGMSDLASDDLSSHNIQQRHRSSTSTALSEISDTSILRNRKDQIKDNIAQKQVVLRQKIKDRELELESFINEKKFAFIDSQKNYINTLQRSLKALQEIPSSAYVMSQEEPISVKIDVTVDSIIELANNIKELSHKNTVARLAGQYSEPTGSLGEAREAIEHYFDYTNDLKAGEEKKAAVDFCLAKKCVTKFKAIEALQQGSQEEYHLYYHSVRCYEEVLEENLFDEFSRALEQAGDMFHYAARAESPDISDLYAKAGDCFKKEGYCYKQNVQELISLDKQQASYLHEAGIKFLSSVKAQRQGNLELAELFLLAGDCFQDIAEALSESSENASKIVPVLEEARSHFLGAIAAIRIGEVELATLQKSLGICRDATASAIRNSSNKFAIKHFQQAYEMYSDALRLNKPEDISFVDVYKIAGKNHFEAGNALLKGENKIADLYGKMAACQHAILKSEPEERKIFKSASGCFFKACESVELNDQEAAEFYERAGAFTEKAAYTKNLTVRSQLGRVATAYLEIVQRKSNGFPEGDEAIQLFKSARLYNQIIAEKIEQGEGQDQGVITSLNQASLFLLLAARYLCGEDLELSNAANNFAASCHCLAIAKNPVLQEKFPSQFQLGFKKEASPNPSLIAYWENAVYENKLKIDALRAGRPQNSHRVNEADQNQA